MIKKKKLLNNVSIYILNEKYFRNCIKDDLIIKFENFGCILDNKNKVYGLQHLLEHAVFENYRNLNILSNASTSMEDMSFELNFSKNYKNTDDPSIKFIKNCFFKNNDYTKIDLSRNLTEKEIKQYVNELDAEYIYRNNLPIPWNLKSLIFSNGDIIYMGGNKNTFLNETKNIQKYLNKPEIINPEEISIFLKKSKINYLDQIESIFSQIKPVKKENLKINLNLEKYYNKIFKINESNTNHLSFILYKKDFKKNYNIFFIISILYPIFDFSITSLDEIFITFFFDDIYSLFNFFNILKFSLYSKISLKECKNFINIYFNYFSINNYLSEEILNFFINNESEITYELCYNKFEKDILDFFKILTNLIKDKKFFFNITKDFIFNEESKISKEKYLMIDTNIIDNYFLNRSLKNFDIIKYINYFSNTKKEKNKFLKCFNKILIINKNDNLIPDNLSTFSLNIKDGKIINYQNNFCNSKLHYGIYINSLILFFTNPVFNTYKDCLEILINNKNLESFIKYYYNDINIKFSKKNFLIKTGYDFIFCIVKVNKIYINKMYYLTYNIEEILKRKGIAYYLEIVVINFEKFSLIFFFTQTEKERSIKFFNIIKNILEINYIKNDMIYVLSEKSQELNFNSLNKFVKFTV